MKLLNITKRSLTLIPENDDDIYVLYTSIREGDLVQAKTSRRVKAKDEDSRDDSKRETVTLEITVEKIEYGSYGNPLRLTGPIVSSSNPNIPLGSYHTLSIVPYMELTITRSQWHDAELDQLNTPTINSSKTMLIVIDDEGCILADVGNFATKTLLEMEFNLPRKTHPDQFEDALTKHFLGILSHLNNLAPHYDCIVVGGPGFIKDEFIEFIRKRMPTYKEKLLSLPLKSSGKRCRNRSH